MNEGLRLLMILVKKVPHLKKLAAVRRAIQRVKQAIKNQRTSRYEDEGKALIRAAEERLDQIIRNRPDRLR